MKALTNPSARDPHTFDQIGNADDHVTDNNANRQRLQVRWATEADVRQFRPDTRETIRARVAVDGDEVLAMTGYFVRNGMAHVFSDIRGDVPKMTIWREAIAMMKRLNLPAVCLADPAIDGSCRFLERLGWRHVETTEHGEVYSWRI